MILNPSIGTAAHGGFSHRGLQRSNNQHVRDEFGLPGTTLFIVDYDDTVLASSWLLARGVRLDSQSIPESVRKELRDLEEFSVSLLSCASKLGKVALVTNAESGWIELSAQKFLPGLIPLLGKTRIFSARSAFETQFPKQVQLWKNKAYDQMFAEAFETQTVLTSCKGRFNVLSIGDSLYERNALLYLSNKMPTQILGKSIKLIERPSVEQLKRQLEILVSNIHALTSIQESIDLMLTVEYIKDCRSTVLNSVS